MDDEDIKKNVVNELYWDAQIDASDIKTEVDSGIVRLEGDVPTYSSKVAAKMDAWNINGVRSVINDLNVRYRTRIPTDEEIQTIVKEKMLWDPYINSSKLNIDVDHGIVTLSGTVDAYWKKMNAEAETERVLGVIDIINKIGVVPSGDFVDEDIAKDITESLYRNISVPEEKVNVNVDKGHVLLTGTVPDWNAYYAAQRAAERTLGVVDVDNDLILE